MEDQTDPYAQMEGLLMQLLQHKITGTSTDLQTIGPILFKLAKDAVSYDIKNKNDTCCLYLNAGGFWKYVCKVMTEADKNYASDVVREFSTQVVSIIIYNTKSDPALMTQLSNKHLMNILLYDWQVFIPPHLDLEAVEAHFNTFKTILGKVIERPILLGIFFQEIVPHICFPVMIKFTEFKWSKSSMAESSFNQKLMELLTLHSKLDISGEESAPSKKRNSLITATKEELLAQHKNLMALKRYLSYFPYANLYVFMICQLWSDIESLRTDLDKYHKPPVLNLKDLEMNLNNHNDHIIRNLEIISDLIKRAPGVSEIFKNLLAKFIINPLIQPLLKNSPEKWLQMRLLFYMLKMITKKIETSSSLIGYTLSILCCSKTSTQYTEDASQPLTLGEKHTKTVFVPTVEKNEKVIKHLLTSVYHGVVDPDEIFAWPFEQLDEEQAVYMNSRGEEGKSYELEDLERNLITQGDGLMHDHLINVAELGQKFAMVSTLDNKPMNKRSSFKSVLISSPKLPPKKEKASIFGSLFSLGNIFSSRAQTPDEQFIETLNKQDPGIMQGLKENVAYIIKSTESSATVKQFLEELAINSPNLPMRQYYKTLQGEAFHFQPHSIPDQSGHWQTNPFNQAFLSAIIVDEGPLRNLIVSWWKSLLAHELPHISNCKKFKFEPVYHNRSYYMFLDDVATYAPATPSVPQTQFRSFADFCLFHMIQWMRGAPVATQTNKQVQEGPEANTKIAYYQVIELIFKHKANADTAIDKKIFDKLAQSVLGEANILADHFIHYSFNQQEQSILVTPLPPNYQPNMEKQQLVLRGQDQLDTVRIITILSDKKRRLAAVFGSVLKDQLNDLTEQIMFLLSAGN